MDNPISDCITSNIQELNLMSAFFFVPPEILFGFDRYSAFSRERTGYVNIVYCCILAHLSRMLIGEFIV